MVDITSIDETVADVEAAPVVKKKAAKSKPRTIRGSTGSFKVKSRVTGKDGWSNLEGHVAEVSQRNGAPYLVVVWDNGSRVTSPADRFKLV